MIKRSGYRSRVPAWECPRQIIIPDHMSQMPGTSQHIIYEVFEECVWPKGNQLTSFEHHQSSCLAKDDETISKHSKPLPSYHKLQHSVFQIPDPDSKSLGVGVCVRVCVCDMIGVDILVVIDGLEGSEVRWIQICKRSESCWKSNAARWLFLSHADLDKAWLGDLFSYLKYGICDLSYESWYLYVEYVRNPWKALDL